jgi:hypothetical protein
MGADTSVMQCWQFDSSTPLISERERRGTEFHKAMRGSARRFYWFNATIKMSLLALSGQISFAAFCPPLGYGGLK